MEKDNRGQVMARRKGRKRSRFTSPGEGLDGLIIFFCLFFLGALWFLGIRTIAVWPWGLIIGSLLGVAGLRTIWGQFL